MSFLRYADAGLRYGEAFGGALTLTRKPSTHELVIHSKSGRQLGVIDEADFVWMDPQAQGQWLHELWDKERRLDPEWRFITQFMDGVVAAYHDPFRNEVVLLDERSKEFQRVSTIAWDDMYESGRSQFVHETYENHINRVRGTNTQGVLDFLAEIGRRWAAA